MFSLFDKTPVLDADSSQWLFDTYAWAMKQFNAEIFYNQTPLVLPTNDYLPGRVDSVHGMASLIFERVKGYAGVSHWPTLLADQSSCALVGPPKVEIKGALRGPEGIADDTADEAHRLLIPYNPQQINNPEGMIATFAHIIAHYLAQMANEPPPGGAEYWPHATELLAVYLGFGVMFANSAFTFRGGCGSCYNPNANRDAYLTEIESTYALAIFGVLKEIPNSEVTRHLKKHLRGTYKKAVGDIQGRTEDLAMLTALR
ncbi:hypothetical protein BOW51_08375 [Solemya velesiana gill symbiont]|uniref:Uncharacterized protein n=1 Tax=Solemya velesiana gill symbiont TaxID=1918948 RepID=A0A1T2KTR9_9GAMM|nr:hypothetical protein BOW51_08375 [Solemya velesiana gill symbiont]